MKKILLQLICVLICASCFSACNSDNSGPKATNLPVAPNNPNITNQIGEFYEVNGELRAMGGLSVLTDKYLKIMIEGKEHEFELSSRAKKEISIYNKDENNLQIMKGTMLVISYHKRNLINVADSIEIVTAN